MLQIAYSVSVLWAPLKLSILLRQPSSGIASRSAPSKGAEEWTIESLVAANTYWPPPSTWEPAGQAELTVVARSTRAFTGPRTG
ncbi:MAG: hypothetical protein E6G49_13045 [Actinobacteria bacterium]|nr:MAG: hypothetical protein E6G49_13045 [Actinomycetota bacterium]